MTRDRERIVLGATVGRSLSVLDGLPQHLAHLGWDVHVVSSGGAELEALGALPGVTATALSMERDPSPLRDLVSLWAWLRYLRRTRPTVLFVGTPKAALLALLAGAVMRVPRRVYILRGLRLESARGVVRIGLEAMERLTCRLAHVVVSVSPSLRAKALELGIVEESKIRVLGAGSSNGVDLVRFRPRPRATHLGDLQLAGDVPVVGFVGRLTRDKGLSTLAEARRTLLENELDHQLLIVGGVDGDADSLAELTSTGRPAVQIGHVPDTAPYYALMDVVVLPTLREGFPNTVLEASASGRPVITTDATGAVDSVVPGRTGLVVPTADPPALAAAIEAVLADVELADRLGRGGRRHVEEHFARADVWDRLVDVLLPAAPAAGTDEPLEGHRDQARDD